MQREKEADINKQRKRHMTDREKDTSQTEKDAHGRQGKRKVIYRERDSDIKRERQRPLERLERV